MMISRDYFLLTNDDYKQLINSRIKAIVDQQEEILIAFIAKYGCEPEEIEQVEVEHPNSGRTWYVRKRAKTVLTVERVKGMIEEKIKELESSLETDKFPPNSIILKVFKFLLKEINEAENDTRSE